MCGYGRLGGPVGGGRGERRRSPRRRIDVHRDRRGNGDRRRAGARRHHAPARRAGGRRGRGLPRRELEPLLIPQGSVAVDGVSLTVAGLGDMSFEVMLIPYTLGATTLGRLRPGQATNVEADVIGKYLVRSLALRGAT